MGVKEYLNYCMPIRECKTCGKKFISKPHYLYKISKKNHTSYYCGYNCYRKAGGDSGKYNLNAEKYKGC